jgi:hypothetical protein
MLRERFRASDYCFDLLISANVESLRAKVSAQQPALSSAITVAHVRLHTLSQPVLGSIQLTTMASKEEYLAEAVLPQALPEVTVQLIFSGGPDIGGEQLYTTALSPFVLGIPSHGVQIYCSDHFLGKNRETWRIHAEAANMFGGNIGANVVTDYYDFFMEIMNRAQNGHADLHECSLRFIAGHGYVANGETYVKCGTNLRFSLFGSNATVLTTLDVCNAPEAVQGLKGTFQPSQVFDSVPFPLASTKSLVAHCFRVSWAGHRNLTESEDQDFAPEDLPNMTEPIGFPVVNSVIAAVKARMEGDDRDLGAIFASKYRSIDTRYVHPGKIRLSS